SIWQTPRRTWLVLANVFLLALAVRLWQLQDGLRVLVDEMQNIRPIVQMWDGPTPLLGQIDGVHYPYTHLYPYVQQVGSAVFGYSLFTLRLPNAIYGALSVLVLYWLIKLLFENRQLALLAAVALATFPFHVHFSRLGIMNLYDPTLAALAFGFAYRGVRHGLRRDWIFAGAALGCTHYVYEGGRLMHTPLLVMWVVLLVLWAWRQGQAVPLRRTLRGVMWAVALSLVMAAPIYITWAGMGASLFGRLNAEALHAERMDVFATAAASTESKLYNIRETAALYVTKTDEWMFYGGRQPIIPTVVQPFFLLGIAAALFTRRRWPVTALPVMVLAATVLSLGLFMRFTLYAARHTVAMLMMALLVAIGVWWLSRLLFQRPRRQIAAAWVIMITLATAQTGYYFGNHLAYYNLQARAVRGYADPDDAVFRILELPPGTHSIIVRGDHRFPRYHPQSFHRYLTGDRLPPPQVIEEAAVTDAWLASLDASTSHALLIELRNRALVDRVFALYPDVRPTLSQNPYVTTEQFVLLYLPAE
ncbi:MAG: glycosyltransferase family 39 protein, partial [Chloroflexota bacterium]